DPITARDYYALYGFFAGTRYPFAGAEEDRRPSEFAPLVAADRAGDFRAKHAETLSRLKSDLAEAETRGEAARKVLDLGLAAAQAESLASVAGPADRAAAAAALEAAKAELARAIRSRDGQLRQLRAEIQRLEEAGPMALAPVAYAVRDGEPTDVKLQVGGDPRKLGQLVPRGVPRVLDPAGAFHRPPND